MSNYPSDMNQNNFDLAHDQWQEDIAEDPPKPYFLLECGHIEIIQSVDGEPFCQKCFEEFDELLEDLLEKKKYELLQKEPHSSDCNVWVNEPCNCILGRVEE